MENYIGRLLDNRYEILEIIGVGGMAVVYKARDHRLKRLVAVKILKDEFSQDDEFRRRFDGESQAIASMSHPNIVAIYDVNDTDGLNYIVMELIDGITLKQYMERRGLLNWRETLHFSLQICKALEHAHAKGMIHRDIKPHNVMVLKDGSVKVADFGIARMAASQSTLTREALGSVHYISPEQAKGGQTDCRSDLYSLGVVMYEMLTGRTPFDGDTPVSVALQHINGKAQMPRELNPDIPEGLEQITMHAMSASLADRYPTASEMLTDLEEFRKDPDIVFTFHPAETPEKRPAQALAGKTDQAKAARENLNKIYGPEDDEEESGPNRGLIIGCVALILALIAVLAFVLLPRLFSNRPVEVPSFVGKSSTEIRPADFRDFEFDPELIFSDDVPRGNVVAQIPAAGSSVEKGTTLVLYISNGPKTNKMPALIGATLEEAQELLDMLELSLTVTLEYAPSENYDKGIITLSDPVSGVTLESGQKIRLVISTGKEEGDPNELTTVPPVSGSTLVDAVNALEAAELQVGTVSEVNSDVAEGTVIGSSVAYGQSVEKGTKINLTVSLGPKEDSEDKKEDAKTEEEPKKEEEKKPEETEKSEKKTVSELVSIYLPPKEEGGPDSVVLSYYLNGTLVDSGDEDPVPLELGSVTVELYGEGTMTLDVYYDGSFAYSQPVVFGE